MAPPTLPEGQVHPLTPTQIYKPYTKKGTVRKRPGPTPKPKFELAKWKNKKPLKRAERSYARERKIEVLMFLLNHKIEEAKPHKIPRRRLGQVEEPAETTVNERGEVVWHRAPTYAEASDWFRIPMPTIHGWWDNRAKILEGTGVDLPKLPEVLPVPQWLKKSQYQAPPRDPPLPDSHRPRPRPRTRPPPPGPPVPPPPPPPIPGIIPPPEFPAATWTVYPPAPGEQIPPPVEGQIILASSVIQIRSPADTHYQPGLNPNGPRHLIPVYAPQPPHGTVVQPPPQPPQAVTPAQPPAAVAAETSPVDTSQTPPPLGPESEEEEEEDEATPAAGSEGEGEAESLSSLSQEPETATDAAESASASPVE